jgi:hypothetical protein
MSPPTDHSDRLPGLTNGIHKASKRGNHFLLLLVANLGKQGEREDSILISICIGKLLWPVLKVAITRQKREGGWIVDDSLDTSSI